MARFLTRRSISSLLPLVVFSAGAVLGACASGRAPSSHDTIPAAASTTVAPQPGESAVIGRDWVFVEIAGFDGPLPSPPPIAGFILTRDGNDRLTGTTACNRMGAGFELDPAAGRLRFVELRNTRMMCDRVAADTEYAVLQAMIATDSYRVVDGRLELWGGGSRQAVLAPPER